MKRTFKYLSVVMSLAIAGNASAYNHNQGKSGDAGSKPKPAVQTKGASCSPANYYKTMAFNDVSARLETGGLLFLDRANGQAAYRVPKTGQSTIIYAAALWMGGTDINGQLKLAAVTYRNDGNDFWPGPLSTDPGSGNYNPNIPQGDNASRDFGPANIDADQCLLYDNIFTITKAGVSTFITYWECNNLLPQPEGCENPTAPSNETMAQIMAWPGNGDPTRLQDPYLAPFYDRNQDGVYNPLDDGDYPWYDDILGRNDVECGSDRRVTLFGDETHWWVFNDKGNIHTESGGEPIGMEIHAQAFSFATDDEINKMTFYNYELINRGTQTLYDTYFSQYADPDIGNYLDDYVGCDVSRGLSYMYNKDLFDETNGQVIGWQQNPPAIGFDFFEGPYQDPDNSDNPGPYFDSITQTNMVPDVATAVAGNGIVYKGLGIGFHDGVVDNERYGMRNFSIYAGQGAGVGQADPGSATQYYNYMRGLWQFGDQLYYGGTGFAGGGGTSIPTHYMFPNDSDPLDWSTGGVQTSYDWSQFEPTGPGTTPANAADWRFVQSAGPFTLRPGAVNNITIGIVFARSYEGEVLSSVNALKTADTKAQALFDNCFRILEPPHAPVLTIQELGNELILMLDNPNNSNNFQEKYKEEDKINIIDPADGSVIYDKFYRFEGYQIFQMSNSTASIADVEDPTKARLVAQCDIKNGVSRLINFEFDEDLGFSTPVKKVDGSDTGIKHTFRVTEDYFASGDRTLVNHKTYYYIAVAYGYNNFKKYDPTDGGYLDGQKMPYLRSRINADGTALKSMAAIPHFVSPELGGTIQNSVYGQTPRITRLDGTGNGGNELAFTQASEDAIVANGFLADPEYDYNSGPINVKVIDPLNVVGGYFTCKFLDYGAVGGIDSSNWVVYRYNEKDGQLLDSVTSETTIAQGNEQVVPEWGISIEIMQNKYYFPDNSGPIVQKFTDPLSSSITFADSTKKWLTFIQDDASMSPLNWIRSGTYEPLAADSQGFAGPAYMNPFCYPDAVGKDPDKKYTKILNGGAGPHKLVGTECDFMPVRTPASYPSYPSAKQNASISFLPSVDIVITSDKSKWTRCIVVELGGDQNLNQGGGKTGELRKHYSVDKNGNDDGTGTQGLGWFPGYAIDLETGARLHMAFGENSFLGGENGSDMIWNPTSTILDANNFPVFGGNQPIWVYGVNINNEGCPYYDGLNNWVYDQYMTATSSAFKKAFTSLMWIVNPVLSEDHSVLESDVRIKLRVSKEYRDFTATNKNGGKPMYGWSMDDIKTTTASQDALTDALDLINVVPNPYYAFSEYERNRIDARVKITNLPDQCTVTIYNVSGKMVRQYKKDNQVTSIDWDLKNAIGVPIASGVYIIHVEVPGIGEKIVKFFGGMRQIDLESI
jgi:hypothetical protein